MDTKDTIRIVLNGGAGEHTVDLGGGQCVSVSVADGGLQCRVHDICDGQVLKKSAAPDNRMRGLESLGSGVDRVLSSLSRALEESRNEIKNLKQDLATARAEKVQVEQQLAAVLAQKAEADKVLMAMVQNDYVGRLVAERSTEHSKARTALEARCFAPLCRVWLIRRDLKAFVASMGRKWKKCDWCIAWKIFDDLRWWTGDEKEFADWVAELGYDMGKFSDAKRNCRDRYGKVRFDQWYAQAYGADHFAVVARGLAALFVGSPAKPTSPAYEEGYMDHTVLHRTIGLSQTGTQGTRAYIHVDSPGRDDQARGKRSKYDRYSIYGKDCKDGRYGRHSAQRSKESFIMAVARHKTFGTIDVLCRAQEMPVGMSRRLRVARTPRAGGALTLLRGPFIR